MTATKSLPQMLSHLATRGNRSLDAAQEPISDLEDLKAILEEIVETIDEYIDAVETYENNDPADATGVDDREYARDARAEAWDDIQQHAEFLATKIDEAVSQCGLETVG